jgi:FkbM family methyltransferase
MTNYEKLTQDYQYKEDALRFVSNWCRHKLFQTLTKKSLPLVLRSGDAMSFGPQVNGVHEPQIKKLIEFWAKQGLADFLIDVGANIGLTSCQSGNKFKQVHMFEPNPDCFNILRINSKIALTNCDSHLYDFGLGQDNSSKILTVPIKNWGGAFINDENNFYTEKMLANKDSFDNFNKNNYQQITIKVQKATEVFKILFSSLESANLNNGVIKIDVEGYELTILEAIAETLPKNFKLAIVFESWDGSFDIDRITKKFDGRAKALKIVRSPSLKKGPPKIIKLLHLLVSGGYSSKLFPCQNGNDNTGDIVLIINGFSL